MVTIAFIANFQRNATSPVYLDLVESLVSGHHKCTKQCGEKCNRPPCDRPCQHPCIGLCGEDCPSLCRICDKDEVTEVFFGTEDEDNAKFIQLKDCKHIFEVSGLDQWMETQSEVQDGEGQSVMVKFVEWPKCKTQSQIWQHY